MSMQRYRAINNTTELITVSMGNKTRFRNAYNYKADILQK